MGLKNVIYMEFWAREVSFYIIMFISVYICFYITATNSAQEIMESNMHIFFCWIHWVFHCYGWDFSRCSKQRLLFAVVGGLLVVVASLVAEHGL